MTSAKARVPPTSSRNRSRRTGSRLATAVIGQPARVSATPSAVPTAPAPTIPMNGGSPGSECWWGWAWSWGSLVAVVVTALAVAGSSVDARPPAVAERLVVGRSAGVVASARPSSFAGTLPCDDSSHRQRGSRVPVHDPFGARASLGAGPPGLYRLRALGRPAWTGGRPMTLKILLENALRHAGGGDRPDRGRRDAPAAGGRAPRPTSRSRSCPRG